MTCIRTGCALISDHRKDIYYWGDMHQIGEALVFNACLDNTGQAREIPIVELHEGAPVFWFDPSPEYFIRRGVFTLQHYAVSPEVKHAGVEAKRG